MSGARLSGPPRGSIRFGWAQIALGAALIACAAWLGGPAWILVWPAVAVMIVGLGYLGLGPGGFGKRPDGSLRLPHFVLLLPYHVVAWLRMHWDAFRHREDAWNQVADGVYLGRRVPVHRLPPRTEVVVDLTAEMPAPRGITDAGRRYVCVPALDTGVPDAGEFDRTLREIASVDAFIYVHCAAGHGRSATFAAALLIARGLARDVDEAEGALKRARPLVHLHRQQRELVSRFARTLPRER